MLASVPDLITVLDTETAGAIGTEWIRYGQRVTVIAFGCDPVWRTEPGLALPGRAHSATTSTTCPWRSSPVPAA